MKLITAATYTNNTVLAVPNVQIKGLFWLEAGIKAGHTHSVQINPRHVEVYLQSRSKRKLISSVFNRVNWLFWLQRTPNPGFTPQPLIHVFVRSHAGRFTPLWELILSVRAVIGLHVQGDIECLLLTYSSDWKEQALWFHSVYTVKARCFFRSDLNN